MLYLASTKNCPTEPVLAVVTRTSAGPAGQRLSFVFPGFAFGFLGCRLACPFCGHKVLNYLAAFFIQTRQLRLYRPVHSGERSDSLFVAKKDSLNFFSVHVPRL